MVSKIINSDVKKIGGPYHRFFLIDNSLEYLDAFKKSAADKSKAVVVIPDDLLRYFRDYICWIPTLFFERKSNTIIRASGLDFEGWSLIDNYGKDLALQIINSLKYLFECAPADIKLMGLYELQKQDYILIEIKKDSILQIFNDLYDIIRQIENGKYILHLGI